MGDSEKSGPNARRAGSNDAATKEAAMMPQQKRPRPQQSRKQGGAERGRQDGLGAGRRWGRASWTVRGRAATKNAGRTRDETLIGRGLRHVSPPHGVCPLHVACMPKPRLEGLLKVGARALHRVARRQGARGRWAPSRGAKESAPDGFRGGAAEREGGGPLDALRAAACEYPFEGHSGRLGITA